MADTDWVKYRQIRGKPLPALAELLGASYQLESLLKRDFYAAVGLYERQSTPDGERETSAPRQVLLKVYHTDPLWFPPLGALGRWLCRREARFLEQLEGVQGIPQLLGLHGPGGLVREYVPGCNLREFSRTAVVDANFFPRLSAILAAVHERGMAHNDLSKPENVLVTPDGAPVLIDFQIARRLLSGPGPIMRAMSRWVIRQMQLTDCYHLAKQHRRRRPLDFTPEQREAMKRKGWLVTLHGWVRRPYRALRHRILRRFLTAGGAAAEVEAGNAAPHRTVRLPSSRRGTGQTTDGLGAAEDRRAR
jgi:serine/threonine protein kinase